MEVQRIAPATWPTSTGLIGVQVVLENGLTVSFHIDLEKPPTSSQLEILEKEIYLIMTEDRPLNQCSRFTNECIRLAKENIGRCYVYTHRIPAELRLEIMTAPSYKRTLSVIGQSKVSPA